MNSQNMTTAASRISVWKRLLIFVSVAVGIAGLTLPLQAANPQVPWECSNYSDDARTRCLNAFIEHQREQIGKLEGQLQAQQDMLGQLRGQVDRQAATAQLQQQYTQPPVTTAIVPAPYTYPFAYAYPSVGIGLYLGRPWIYGPGYGYYGRPFWGPRFYGYRGRHW